MKTGEKKSKKVKNTFCNENTDKKKTSFLHFAFFMAVKKRMYKKNNIKLCLRVSSICKLVKNDNQSSTSSTNGAVLKTNSIKNSTNNIAIRICALLPVATIHIAPVNNIFFTNTTTSYHQYSSSYLFEQKNKH